jgi:hypothetical protein
MPTEITPMMTHARHHAMVPAGIKSRTASRTVVLRNLMANLKPDIRMG